MRHAPELAPLVRTAEAATGCGRQEALRLPPRPESLPLALPPARRMVGNLSSIVRPWHGSRLMLSGTGSLGEPRRRAEDGMREAARYTFCRKPNSASTRTHGAQ